MIAEVRLLLLILRKWHDPSLLVLPGSVQSEGRSSLYGQSPSHTSHPNHSATRTILSAAGQWLKVDVDRAGRVKVLSDLSVPGHANIFVIGDTASVTQDGKLLPGVAPVAM